MTFTSNRGRVPQTPTLPSGVQIASFDTYLEAQRAVDLLSDEEFEVQHTTIVGTDLRMVERITGRLSYPRVALAGAMSGAWFGLFVGLVFGLLSEGPIFVMLLPALVIGAAFGILFALVSYAFTGGKRDFTSTSQVVASKYALLCEQSRVGQAMSLLNGAGIRTRVGGEPATAQVPYGQPGRYGQQAGQSGPYGQQAGQAGPYGQQAGQPGQPGQQAGQPGQPGPYGQQAGQPQQPDAAGSDRPPAPGRGPTPWEDEHGNPRYGQRRPPAPDQPGTDQESRSDHSSRTDQAPPGAASHTSTNDVEGDRA